MESWRLYEYISYVLRRTQKHTIKFPKNTIIERSSSWPVLMGLRIGCNLETNSNICTKCVQFGCNVFFFFCFCFFFRCNKSSHKIFNSILYSDCQIHFSASTKHVIKGHQTITNYTLNLGGFDSANWPTRMWTS